ncbi:MAG TPA: DUF3096 domain-containing protein [Dehalococcoidales bacterium]|nr:DUF3096 domain-containing protein [Dehalococcoidales bacterium]
MSFVGISGLVGGIIAVIAGFIVILWPRILGYVVGAWLMAVGIIAIVNAIRVALTFVPTLPSMPALF